MWVTAAWKQLLLLPTVTKMKRFCQALHIQTKSHHCLAWLLSGALKLPGVSPASTMVLFLRKYIHCIYIHFMSHGPVLHWLADWCHSGRVWGWSCGTDGKLTCQLCRIQPDSDWYLSSAAGSCHMLIPDTQAGQLRSPQSPSHTHKHRERERERSMFGLFDSSEQICHFTVSRGHPRFKGPACLQPWLSWCWRLAITAEVNETELK